MIHLQHRLPRSGRGGHGGRCFRGGRRFVGRRRRRFDRLAQLQRIGTRRRRRPGGRLHRRGRFRSHRDRLRGGRGGKRRRFEMRLQCGLRRVERGDRRRKGRQRRRRGFGDGRGGRLRLRGGNNVRGFLGKGDRNGQSPRRFRGLRVADRPVVRRQHGRQRHAGGAGIGAENRANDPQCFGRGNHRPPRQGRFDRPLARLCQASEQAFDRTGGLGGRRRGFLQQNHLGSAPRRGRRGGRRRLLDQHLAQRDGGTNGQRRHRFFPLLPVSSNKGLVHRGHGKSYALHGLKRYETQSRRTVRLIVGRSHYNWWKGLRSRLATARRLPATAAPAGPAAIAPPNCLPAAPAEAAANSAAAARRARTPCSDRA